MAYNLATLLLVLQTIFFLSLTSSANVEPLSSTSSVSSSQTNFWSKTVQNQMPESISTKLSPLTKQASQYYAAAMSRDSFRADANFCSLAKLACAVRPDQINTVREAYRNKIYQAGNEVSLDKVDPFTFFRVSILEQGNTIHISNLKEPLQHRSFLPALLASKITLDTESITRSFPEASPDAVKMVLAYCNAEAVTGETKTCTKSLEEMIGFAQSALAGRNKLVSLATTNTRGSGKEMKIQGIKKFDVEKIVACHELFLPFATNFCHLIPNSRIYSVNLVDPESVTSVNTAFAICHMDTSPFPADHVAFKILKFGPGEGEACHWMNENDLAWIEGGEKV